jgi:hypothetical protein
MAQVVEATGLCHGAAFGAGASPAMNFTR